MMAVPALRPNDLLAHADRLVRPSSAGAEVTDIDIRRSISASYDALLHAITSRLAKQLLPGSNSSSERAELVRSIDHHAVRRVSQWISRNATPPKHVVALVSILRDESWLVTVCDAFLELMESRHSADYDHLAPHDEALVFEVLATSSLAIDAVGTANDGSEAAAIWPVLICLATRV